MVQFISIREIIHHYEKNRLPIIKKELAACGSIEDYIYGKKAIYKEKSISCDSIYDSIIEELDSNNYSEKADEEISNINVLSQLYEIIVSDDIRFKSPNSHQSRWYGKLGNVISAFAALGNIQDYRFTNFEHLYDVVRSVFIIAGHPYAFLTIYDTALRIGYNHKEQILPSKFVYLYGSEDVGPMSAAIKLYGQAWVDKHLDKDYPYRIKARWFGDKFPNLTAWEIESILCIYAKYFTTGMVY